MLPAGLTARYAFRRSVGEGGFGAVAEAEDRETGRRVAIKTLTELDETGQERFRREARTLAAVRHPGVVEVLDFGVADGVPYLVMELVEGGPLPPPPWPEAEVVACIEQVAAALDQLHQQGLVHRDLKPENLLRRQDGSVVLVDFGLARATGQGSTVTQEGLLLGTPGYMAPELWGLEAASAASDQFALAAVACRLLTGEGVLPDGSPGEVCRAALGGGAVVPAGVPASWRAALARALERAPQARFGSCGELARALQLAAGHGVPPAPGHPGSSAGERTVVARSRGLGAESKKGAGWGPRGWMVVAALAVGCLVLGLAMGPQISPGPAPMATPADPAPVPEVEVDAAVEEAARAAVTRRLDAARVRMSELLDGNERDLMGFGTRELRDHLIREAGVVPAWGEYVEALAAFLGTRPGGEAVPKDLRDSFRILRAVSDTDRLVRDRFRVGFEMSVEERRRLPPRVEDMLRSAENAFAPLLGHDHPPARKLALVSLLVMAGYPDPAALVETADKELAATPPGRGREVANYMMTFSIGEISGSHRMPCSLRRRWVAWGFDALGAPPETSPDRARDWARRFQELVESTVVLSNHACRDQEPALAPYLERALEGFLAARERSSGEIFVRLRQHDQDLGELSLREPMHPDLEAPMARLADAVQAALGEGESRQRWRRLFETLPSHGR